MNSLEKYIRKNLLDGVKVMNALMEAGKISDNCVTASDVADADCAAAVHWLETQPHKPLK